MSHERPLQIAVTFKTLLLGIAMFFLTWAIVSIRDTLLIVAVGIFLGLVFEGIGERRPHIPDAITV